MNKKKFLRKFHEHLTSNFTKRSSMIFGRSSGSHCVKNIQIPSIFWSVFSRTWTEYGEILRISPYSVRMRENTDQKILRI